MPTKCSVRTQCMDTMHIDQSRMVGVCMSTSGSHFHMMFGIFGLL